MALSHEPTARTFSSITAPFREGVTSLDEWVVANDVGAHLLPLVIALLLPTAVYWRDHVQV